MSGAFDSGAGNISRVRRVLRVLEAALNGALTPISAIGLLLGALLVMRLSQLPPSWLAWLLCLLGITLWLGLRRARWVGAALFGFGWTCALSAHAMSLRLPPSLAGATIEVSGRIVGLPQRDEYTLRFDLRADATGNRPELAGRLLHLGWNDTHRELAPGERWRMPLRLKRPRGTINPGGFDFERWALQRRIAAIGYVHGDSAQRLAPASGVDALRARWSQAITKAAPSTGSRFVRALALGDTRGLEQHDWDVLRAIGLTHLVAISGLHVGIVAGFGAWLMLGIYMLFPRFGLRLPRPQAQAIGALALALAYAALAGFALPTVRALLMVMAVLAARLLRRPTSMPQSLALALAVIVVMDPLAILAPGFWLSFAGVAWLVICLPDANAGGRIRALFDAQRVATLGLLPLTIWFFGQASLIAPVANLVAIPWVTLVAVPLSLLGLVLQLTFPALGAPVLRLAAWTMDAIWPVLERIAAWPGSLAWLPQPSVFVLTLAVLGVLWLLLPRGIPGKPLALLLLLPLLWPQPARVATGEAQLAMIDVGQGLSVLVRTRSHTLVYDTGPSFRGGLDLGEAAVVPSMHALNVPRLDALVISHGDNDHFGGADAVLQAYPTQVRFAPTGMPKGIGYAPCLMGSHWQWDGVQFQFLHPPLYFPYLGNDSSCVLRISTSQWSALLTGDMSEVIESRLVREQPDLIRADVITVPHHGSKTASSVSFINAVQAKYALIGVGYGNRFHHPRLPIVQRWLDSGSEVEDTASGGMLMLRLDASGAHLVSRARQQQRRFWQDAVPSSARLAQQAQLEPDPE